MDVYRYFWELFYFPQSFCKFDQRWGTSSSAAFSLADNTICPPSLSFLSSRHLLHLFLSIYLSVTLSRSEKGRLNEDSEGVV